MHDISVAETCIAALPPARYVLADKGYDSKPFREWLRKRGTKSIIPPRNGRKVRFRYDKQLYKLRNRIERSFGRFKDFRRVAACFDRNVRNLTATPCIAAIVIWWIQ